jgi:uncharacterized protein with NAD-binding domain and iron-sulfur cluster
MPDIAALSALVTNFKAATDIARGLLDLKVTAEVQAKVVALQSAIMAAQAAAMSTQTDLVAANQKIEALEKELASLVAWEKEKQRYQLQAVHKDTFAYVLKPEAANNEPPHWLCANCFVQNRKSILQLTSESSGQRTYLCHSCKNQIQVGEWRPPPIRRDYNPYS